MISVWLKAFRLKTLPLSFACILFGSFLAYHPTSFNWFILGLSLLTTLLLQVLSNLANDLGDAQKGTDINRIGPERLVQSGKISFKQMKFAVIIFSVLSLIVGLILIVYAFGARNLIYIISFLALGIAAIAAAIFYTLGKKPYGYMALGDLFVLIFFGWIGVLGSYFLQEINFNWNYFLPATSIGLMAVAVLNMNNIRDIESDKISNKITLPLLLGRKKAIIYHVLVVLTALIFMVIFSIQYFNFWWQYIIFLAFIPFVLNLKNVYSYQNPSELNPELKRVAVTTFFISLLFSVTQIIKYFAS